MAGAQAHREFLKGLQSFAALRPEHFEALVELLQPKDLMSGVTLFRADTPGTAAHIVVSGHLQLALERLGKQQELTSLGAGELVGHVELLDGGHHNATCKAIERSVVLTLEKTSFEALLAKRSSFALELLELLTRLVVAQLRTANATLSKLVDGERLAAAPRAMNDPAVQAVFREIAGQAERVSLGRSGSVRAVKL